MVLRVGDSGVVVERLQKMLQTLGLLRGTVDGKFGNATKAAVAAFQSAFFVDGIVDDFTFSAIETAIGSRSGRDILLSVPHGLPAIEETFGAIQFRDLDAGAIEITNGWIADNIVTADLPVVGKIQVHVKMEPVFRAVLQDLVDLGLDGLVLQFGVWSPRHKMHDLKRGLSAHSWAIACDINWATNPPGAVGDLDPRIVAAFEARGFEWGGRWRVRDDMHAQYCSGW